MPKIDLFVRILMFWIGALTPITALSKPSPTAPLNLRCAFSALPHLPVWRDLHNFYQLAHDPAITFIGLPPVTQTVECQADIPVPNVGAISNCSGTAGTTLKEWTSHESGSCVNDYVIWREWTAEDNCGNQAVFTGKIIVRDRTPPVLLNVPANITGDCVETLCPFPPEAVDLCGNAFISYFHESSRCEPGKIIITRTWVASDNCLNTTQVVQTAVALDDTPPVPRDVPASTTILAGEPLPAAGNPWGDDLCYPAQETTVHFREETYTDRVLRIWNFCDCASNCVADTQQILITGNWPPEFSGLPSGAFTTAGISCFEFELLVDQVQAFDPPGYDEVGVDYTSTVAYDPCGQRNTTTVTFLATDDTGLGSSASVPIRLLEDQCLPIQYCGSNSADAGALWIQRVKFGNSAKNSAGSNYSDFTGTVFQAVAGGTYPLELTPNLNTLPTATWSIWLDLNRDGVFDNQDERVTTGTNAGVSTVPLHIPVDAATGIIRMRIALSADVLSQACGQFGSGEVEDYHLRIKGPECLPDACIPAYNPQTQLWEYISRVRLGGMTNLSGAARYSDFRNLAPVPVERGQTYSLLATASSKIGYYGNRFWDVYADFNRDGDFNDASELVATQALQAGQASFSLSIPADAVPGLTNLRLVLSRNTNSNACGIVSYGEIEDYAIQIKPTATDSVLARGPVDDRKDSDIISGAPLFWSVQPNPTSDFSSVVIQAAEGENLTLLVTDLLGETLLFRPIVGQESPTQIGLNTNLWAPGMYSLILYNRQSADRKILVVAR